MRVIFILGGILTTIFMGVQFFSFKPSEDVVKNLKDRYPEGSFEYIEELEKISYDSRKFKIRSSLGDFTVERYFIDGKPVYHDSYFGMANYDRLYSIVKTITGLESFYLDMEESSFPDDVRSSDDVLDVLASPDCRLAVKVVDATGEVAANSSKILKNLYIGCGAKVDFYVLIGDFKLESFDTDFKSSRAEGKRSCFSSNTSGGSAFKNNY